MFELVVENLMGKVEWDPETRAVIKTFVGFVKGDPMKEIFDKGLAKLKYERGCIWISDNRKIKPYSTESIQWINEDWFPRIKAAGWKYWPIVEPESVTGGLSMNNFTEFYAGEGIELHIVRTVEEAREWAKSKH